MTGDERDQDGPARGRDAHAAAVARAMRENLKKRKAKARARRECRGVDAGEGAEPEGEAGPQDG